jgi:xanthine dehydrogenase accessory factor
MAVSMDETSGSGNELDERVKPVLGDLLNDKNGVFFSSIETGKQGEATDGLILLEALFPLPRLIIAGAGHIGKALSHLGRLLDFEVTVIDGRSEFANPVNIPDAHNFIVQDVGKSFTAMELTADSYVVIVTRGHNDDAAALKGCIGSKACYIGMIGSRTMIEKMRRNFLENSWASAEQWESVHSPVGIEINSKTVEEIAVSIAAELILVRNSLKK